MSNSKNTDILCILITLLAVVVTVFFMNGEALGETRVTSDVTADQKGTFSERDYKEDWNPAVATEISLNDLEHFSCGGAYELNGDLYIVRKGIYVLSGEMEDHQIIVSAENEKVQLVLAGVTIKEKEKAAICIKEADKVFLTLESGKENVIKTGSLESETIQEEEAKESLPDAAIYSNDDLTINGSGTLNISVEEGHGIKSKDDLVIVNGNLCIDAGNTALLGKDSVRIGGGSLDLTAGNDGIQANNETDEEKGYVKIVDGILVIQAEHDGVQAQTSLEIDGGEITITTGGGYENAEQKQETFGPGNFSGSHENMGIPADKPMKGERPERAEPPEGMQEGMMPKQHNGAQMAPPDFQEPPKMPEETGAENTENTEANSTKDSSKGLKAGKLIHISGGTIVLDTKEDAIHSDADLLLEDGSITIKAGDDALHAEDAMTVKGGNLFAATCYEGLEANNIEVSGGVIDLTSSDDAVNASGFAAGEDRPLLHITGGELHADASGDGLDSNGDMVIEGGRIIIDGPSDAGNGALDSGTESGGDLIIHGGTVLALGASGMAETFSENSTQYSFLCTFDISYEQGDLITIADSSGEILFSYVAQKNGDSVVFSSAELKNGETYVITAGIAEQTMKIEAITNGKSTGMGRERWNRQFPDERSTFTEGE